MEAASLDQYVAVEEISPEEASRLLARNLRNRSLRVERVHELSGAMQRGEWELNGETIKLSVDGELLDGQHRLQAVLHSGVTISSVVVRGLPAGAQDTIDTGRRRRLADVFAIEGYPDAIALASGVSMLHRLRNKHRIDYARRTAPTAQQALALLADNPGLVESTRTARGVTKAIGGPIGVFIALHHEFGQRDQYAAEEFFMSLSDGAGLSRSDPLLHLRNHVLRRSNDRDFAQLPLPVAGLTIKAFNLRRAGCCVAKLSFAPDEMLPEIGATPQ